MEPKSLGQGQLASGMAGSRGSIYVMGLDFSTLISAFLPTGFILKQAAPCGVPSFCAWHVENSPQPSNRPASGARLPRATHYLCLRDVDSTLGEMEQKKRKYHTG